MDRERNDVPRRDMDNYSYNQDSTQNFREQVWNRDEPRDYNNSRVYHDRAGNTTIIIEGDVYVNGNGRGGNCNDDRRCTPSRQVYQDNNYYRQTQRVNDRYYVDDRYDNGYNRNDGYYNRDVYASSPGGQVRINNRGYDDGYGRGRDGFDTAQDILGVIAGAAGIYSVIEGARHHGRNGNWNNRGGNWHDHNRGGGYYDRGGYDRGGYYNNGGYNNGGWNNGGYYNNGGCHNRDNYNNRFNQGCYSNGRMYPPGWHGGRR